VEKSRTEMSRSMYGTRPKSSAERAPAGLPGVSACSACAGDYEDPERTAAPLRVKDAAPLEGEEADSTAWPGDATEED
jgi:hypothetical protein